MRKQADQLSERLLDYGVEIVRLTMRLRNTPTERHVGRELLRAGTSVGANYEEARGGQSRADFVHKLQIVLKEIRESLYWLRLIQKSGILDDENLAGLIDETRQISKIIAKSIITTKGGQRRKRRISESQ